MPFTDYEDRRFELIRKALDEQQYDCHYELLDWLSKTIMQARLGAMVEAMPVGDSLEHLATGLVPEWEWTYKRQGSVEYRDKTAVETIKPCLPGYDPKTGILSL